MHFNIRKQRKMFTQEKEFLINHLILFQIFKNLLTTNSLHILTYRIKNPITKKVSINL
jgi:hypothetical protein